MTRIYQETNITGQKFGSLTAIKRDFSIKNKTFWTFQCGCGKIKSIFKYDVIQGKTTNCGCVNMKAKTRLNNIISTMVGKRYGKLTIKNFAFIKNGNSHWNCKCDCGNEIILPRPSLNTGNTTSCGCSRIYSKNSGESGLKRLYGRYKAQAKINHRSFDLTLEEFKDITSKKCAYCGADPCCVLSLRYHTNVKIVQYTKYVYNGLDRIDSKKGYEKDNVAPCCKWCNIVKRERSFEDFKNHTIRIYNHLMQNENLKKM